MSKSATLLLVLIFLIASCIVAAMPVSTASAVENSWAELAPMHQARAGLGVVAVNGNIYAIGGFTCVDTPRAHKCVSVGTNEEFDPATNNWTTKASMRTPRAFFAIAAFQSKIYCIGGTTDFSGFSTLNEVYDPVTDSWETKAPTPTARVGMQANVINGKIYLTGGMDSTHVLSNVTEVYDPADNTWTTRAPMPYATGEASAVIDNKIYSFGTDYNYSNYGTFSVTQIYNPETNTWSQGTAPPDNNFGGEYGASGVADSTTGIIAPKQIYVYCGSFNGSPLQVYNPQNDSWSLSRVNPPLNQYCGVGVVDDMLYFIGGYALIYANLCNDPVNTCYASNEQYTPFGYGTAPPAIAVVSPENTNYTSSNVSLTFTLNKPAVWMGYSLDGEENVTINGNTTIAGLPNGLHNVTIYAKDSFENTGASETISFSVEVPFPTALVAATVVAIVATGTGFSAVYHLRKRKNKHPTPP
jgi:N-acetylneuraminic acid mutarotase